MHNSARPSSRAGFTLTEILIAVAILAVLVAVAVPSMERYRQRALILKAAADIGAMSVSMGHYRLDNSELPPSLTEVGYGTRMDPWGRP